MRFSENRALAYVLLVIIIVSCILFLGGGALKNDQIAAYDLYKNGEDGDGLNSISGYLSRCSEKANLLAQTASLYIEDTANIDAVKNDAAALQNAATVADANAAYQNLTGAVEELYTQILASKLSDDAMSDVDLYYYDYKGAVNLIQNDPYHATAATFNSTLVHFPASFIASLMHIEPVEPFAR